MIGLIVEWRFKSYSCGKECGLSQLMCNAVCVYDRSTIKAKSGFDDFISSGRKGPRYGIANVLNVFHAANLDVKNLIISRTS